MRSILIVVRTQKKKKKRVNNRVPTSADRISIDIIDKEHAIHDMKTKANLGTAKFRQRLRPNRSGNLCSTCAILKGLLRIRNLSVKFASSYRVVPIPVTMLGWTLFYQVYYVDSLLPKGICTCTKFSRKDKYLRCFSDGVAAIMRCRKQIVFLRRFEYERYGVINKLRLYIL